MKIISVIGDSHTWGQGVGTEAYLEPSAQSGDLRMLPFGFPAYVNLIRDAFNIKYGSSQKEYYFKGLEPLCDRMDGQFGVLKDKKIVLKEKFGLVRIFMKWGSEHTGIKMKVDGIDLGGSESFEIKENIGFNSNIKLWNLSLPDDLHELEIEAKDGTKLKIFRIELYTGEYAVVNCGIGSCNTEKYLKEYFTHYVSELDPHAVIFEGNTINDWLKGESTEIYRKDLINLINDIRLYTDKIIMHTPMPIGGSPYCKENGELYDEYIETMKSVAEELNIPLADTYGVMKKLIADVPEDRLDAFFFADKWHPNGTGHYVYAREILKLADKLK